jgi:hypothetical protein
MSQPSPPPDPRVISYLALRKVIGLIGILLPFVLAGVNMLLVSRVIVQGSVSAYYYTGMRDVLVGGLCAIGVFLFAYHGYGFWDDRCTNAAGIFAVCAAFFPTAPPDPSFADTVAGWVHLTSAGLLFAVLAVIALWLFPKTVPGSVRSPRKKQRDLVFRVCGGVIAACLVLVPVEAFVIGAPIAGHHPLFWLEATAVFAFGVAWLVKGQAILKDPAPDPGTAPAAPHPAGAVAVGPAGDILIADTGNDRVRQVGG